MTEFKLNETQMYTTRRALEYHMLRMLDDAAQALARNPGCDLSDDRDRYLSDAELYNAMGAALYPDSFFPYNYVATADAYNEKIERRLGIMAQTPQARRGLQTFIAQSGV